MDARQPDNSASVPTMAPPPPGSPGPISRATNDFAAAAQMLNDILSLGSGEQLASAEGTLSAATGSTTRTRSGPRPVPELDMSIPAFDGPLTQDFFTSSKSKKRPWWATRH